MANPYLTQALYGPKPSNPSVDKTPKVEPTEEPQRPTNQEPNSGNGNWIHPARQQLMASNVPAEDPTEIVTVCKTGSNLLPLGRKRASPRSQPVSSTSPELTVAATGFQSASLTSGNQVNAAMDPRRNRGPEPRAAYYLPSHTLIDPKLVQLIADHVGSQTPSLATGVVPMPTNASATNGSLALYPMIGQNQLHAQPLQTGSPFASPLDSEPMRGIQSTMEIRIQELENQVAELKRANDALAMDVKKWKTAYEQLHKSPEGRAGPETPGIASDEFGFVPRGKKRRRNKRGY